MRKSVASAVSAAVLLLLLSSAAATQPAPAERATPVAPLERFFSPPDHPEGAGSRRGTTSVRLTVGENGRVTGCSVRVSSGSALLDSTTCRLLVNRARFRPTRDASGAAMEDRYDAAISWPPTGAGTTSASPPPPRLLAQPVPRGSLQGLFRHDDLPSSALASGRSGATAVQLTVGADGRVAACTVTRSSGVRALDNATCSVLRSRARFTPARDSNGMTVTSTHDATITWTLAPQG